MKLRLPDIVLQTYILIRVIRTVLIIIKVTDILSLKSNGLDISFSRRLNIILFRKLGMLAKSFDIFLLLFDGIEQFSYNFFFFFRFRMEM